MTLAWRRWMPSSQRPQVSLLRAQKAGAGLLQGFHTHLLPKAKHFEVLFVFFLSQGLCIFIQIAFYQEEFYNPTQGDFSSWKRIRSHWVDDKCQHISYQEPLQIFFPPVWELCSLYCKKLRRETLEIRSFSLLCAPASSCSCGTSFKKPVLPFFHFEAKQKVSEKWRPIL